MSKHDQTTKIKEAAKGLVAMCVRNTVLEDYHAEQVPITDERMRALMQECVNNVFFVLTGLCAYDNAEVCENMIDILRDKAEKYAYNWDEPDFPDWVYARLRPSNKSEQH